MKLRLPYALIKALGCAFGVAVTTLGTTNSYGAGMHSQVSIVTYTDFGQNMGRYRVNGVNALLSGIRTRDGGVVLTYQDAIADPNRPHEVTAAPADYTMTTPMISFESQGENGAYAAIGYNYIATVQHNGCQNPTFTNRYIAGTDSLHYYGVEYRDALTFCLVAQSDDQTKTHDYKVTRLNRLITDVTPSTPASPMSAEEIRALPGTMEYRSGAGTMSLWSLDGTNTSLASAYAYAIGGMRLINGSSVDDAQNGFFTTACTMEYGAEGLSTSDPLPFAPAGGDSGSPVWIWDEGSQSYVYLDAYQSIFGVPGGGARGANARGALDYTWKALQKFDKAVDASGGTVHIKGVVAKADDKVISEDKGDHVYTTKLHMGSVVDAQGNTLQQFVGVKGDDDKYINTWLNLAPEKDKANWFAYDNKYYNVGEYNKVQRELNIEDLFFTENLVFQASAATGNTVAVDADTDLGIGYMQFSIAPDAGIGHADFTLQTNGQTSGGKGGAQRDFMLNSAGFVVDANVDLHVKLTNTEWDSAANDYYYREWRKVGDGNLYLEGTGNNEILLNVGGSGTTYLNETDGYAAYNVYVGSGATVVMDSTSQIARDFTFGYNGGVLDIRGNNSMDWYRTNTNVAAQGFSINSFSEDSYITNSLAGTTLNLTYKAGGSTEYIGSFVDTKDGGTVCITFDAGSGSATTLHGIHTSLANAGSGITVHSGTVTLSGTNTVHGLGSATGRNADRYLSTDDWHYADMATKVQVDNGAVFELGSHARLTGDVTVKAGGRLMVREGVHSTYEYIEGGLRLEDATTAFYRQYYGLKGNVSTEAGSTVEFSYSPGTTAEQVYAGNITGGANVVISLGGSGATLRLSGTNTFSGSKMLSGGGLISDNGLDALGNTDSTHWLVADTAFIAAFGTSGSELLGKLNTSSTGVLALTRNQAADLELQANGYSGLIVGALAGQEIHYGTQEDSLASVQNGGKDRWLLGGGGGNLIVDFALVNKDAELVIGNAHTSGTVTLTNENNHFASITLNGQMMLEYTSEAALGGAKTTLNYTNRLMSLGAGVLSSVTEDSTGVILVDRVPGAAFDLSNHQGLYIGASADTVLTSAPTVASGSAYRFGGIDGTLTVNATLQDSGSQATGLVVDGQTFSGGVLELGQAATITGDVTVRGYDPDLLPSGMPGKGDITLRLSAENALANAASVDVASGGTIDIHGTTQSLRNLSMDSGSLLTDSSSGYSGVLDLDITAASTISGTLDVRQVNKRGSETLQLYGTSIVDAYDVYEGTLKALSTSSISGNVTVHDGATIELAGGNTGINLSMGDGSKLRVTSGTATVGSLTVADNATMTLLSGGTLKFAGAESISKAGTTINLLGGSLDVSADQDLLFGSRIQASGNAESKLSISGGTADKSYARRFEHISVEQGSTLTLEQTVQETTPMYEIHGLSGQGTFVISQGTYKDAPTFYKFNRDTDFAGTLKLVAGTAYSGRAYMSHTLIQSDNALANAQVQMQGWLNNSNGIITLGIDTENASIKGLATLQNNRSVLMAGATTATTAGTLPVSSRRATLTITGSESTEFTGQVVGGASGTDHGLSIVMNGNGTQTFSGVSVFNDVSALKGTLRISNSNENTAIKGDLTVARGATLYISKAYTLGSGKTLHVVGKASANTAQLTVPLTFSGGTIDFSGDALNGSMAALHLSSSISGSATISFSETSLLQTGVTYKLADGNWSNISLTTASLDYLTANVSATSTGLTATFSLRGDSYIWDGNSAQHTWTTSNFGQRSMSFQNTYRAVFTDTAESKDVQVNASISAASLIIDSTGEYTFGGSGTVTASTLSQLSSGTTNIDSSVKITGQAHVQAGTLAMHSGASTGSVLVDGNGTLSLKDPGISTGEISGNGTLAIDWGSQSGGIPSIGSSGIGSLNVVSGTLSITDVPNVQRGIFVGGNGILELNYANNGTLDKSISGIGDSRGKVAKAGNGTLTVAAGITADSLTVSGGSVVVNKEASLDLNSLAIGNAKTVVLHRDGNSVRNIGSVQMDLSSKLTLYSDAEPSTAMNVDSLELYGAYASVVQENISGAILFRSLSRKGSTDVTLNLDSTAAYQKISVFELGGADDTPGDFSGEITLNCTSGSQYNRSSALLLDDANVAAGAVINLKSATSPAAVLALGVNAEVVNIAGLTSNSAIGARARLFSGSVAPSTMLSDEAFAGSDETHKLVITTASGKDYSYYGSIGRNVDLTVAGSGTQRLLGTGTAFSGMLTVQSGTLEIGNAESFGSASESGGFGVTLAGGTLVLSGGSLNLGNASLVLAQDTTVSMGTAGSYSYQDGNDSENGFSLMTVIKSGSVDNQGGTVTGAGALSGKELRIMENGVFALDPDHRNTYYVNTTVNYGPQAAGSAYANADSLVLNHNGAVLNMQAGLSDTAAANGIKAQVAGGQVNLAQGVTLHQNTISDTTNVKIGGAGTYQVQVKTGDSNINTTLGVNNHVTLADGWTGTVELLGAGGNHSHLVLENYGNSLSTVKLTGNAGWLSSGQTFAVNLLLEDAENQSALTITNGSTNGTETFNGSVSGSGTMEMAWKSTLDFKFNGDLSGWTGGFKTTAGTANVHLLAGVTDVGAAIQATSLTVGADASAGANVTFLNTVRAATFTAHGSVTVGDSGTLDLTALTSAATLDALTLGAGSTTVLNRTSMLTATGTLAVENGATLDLTGLSVSGTPQSYVLATGGNVTLGESVSFTLADETLLERASLGVVDGTSLVLTLSAEMADLVWQGHDGTWSTDAGQTPWYKAGTQTASAFRDNDKVHFATSQESTATLGSNVSAFSLTMEQNARAAIDLGRYTLATRSMELSLGSELTLVGTAASGAQVNSGALVMDGASLRLSHSGASFSLGAVEMKHGAVLNVSSAASATADSLRATAGSSSIVLGQDMSIAAHGSEDTYAGMLAVVNDSTSLNIQSANSGSVKSITAEKLAVSGSGSVLSLQDVNLNVSGAATAAPLAGGTVTVGSGATLNLNGSVDGLNLTVQNGGGVYVNQGTANTLGDITVQDGGSLSLAAGTSTSLLGGVSLAEAISNTGTLNFANRTMTIDLDNTFTVDAAGYTSFDGVEGDNGYYHTLGGTVVANASSGSIINAGGVQVSYGGTEYDLRADGTFGKTYDRTVYHVRSGAVDYSGIASEAGITSVSLEGGILNLNAPLAASVTSGIQSQGGTVNIGSGITLQAASLTASASTTLTGSGTYALANASAMPQGVSLSPDWTGTVRFTGTSNNLNLANAWVGQDASASTVEIRDWSGTLSSQTIGAKVLLSTENVYQAMGISNDTETNVTFANGVAGDSTASVLHDGTGTLNITFTGADVTWRGTLLNASGFAEITYRDIDHAANTIYCMEGTVDVHLDRVADFSGGIMAVRTLYLSGSSALDNSVYVENISMANGSALTIGGTTTVTGDITGPANIAVEAGAALRLSGNITNLAAPISNSGSVEFDGSSQTITLDSSAFDITEKYRDEHGAETTDGNGVYLGGTAQVITLSGDGTITGASSVSVSLDGTNYTLADNGWISSGTPQPNVYHVRTGEATYSSFMGMSGVNTISLEGAQLNLDTAIAPATSGGILSSGGIVNIGSGVTLQASSLSATASTILTGSGVYAISYPDTSSPSLGSNVSLGEGWHGVLRLSGGGSKVNIPLNTLAGHAVSGTTAYSTVEFDGASGYFQGGGTNTFASDIVLAADHDNRSAMDVSNGNSNAEYTFSGKVSGSGTFERSATGPGNLTFIFTGDVSEWNGLFKQTSSKSTTYVKFVDNPLSAGASTVDIAAGVSNTGSGNMELTYDNDHAVQVLGNISRTGTGTLNMTVAAGTDASFTGNVTGVSSLTLAGTATFSGTNALTNVTVEDGSTLRIAGGTTSISGSVSLAEQVQNAGVVDFGGNTLTITLANDPDAFHVLNPGYIDIDGNEGNNGFHHGVYGTVIEGAGTISGSGHVTVSYNGATHAFNADGTFGTMDWTTYHVRSGVVDYGSDMAGATSITTVAVSNNATLNVNTGLANGVGITSAGGSINIAENVALDHASIQASAPTTIGGKGKLVLADNSIAIPGNVTLGTDWEGVVAVSGVSLSGTFTPAPLANENSWIEIKGLSGYLSTGANSTYVVSNNLVLAGDADGWAFKQTDGYGGSTVSFTGTLKGSGNLGRSKGTGSNYTYEFSGDISGWNGKFISTNNNDCYTMFRVKGDATLVNAGFTNNGTDFRVEVQNHATFTKSLSADKLTVTSGGEAVFTGESVQFKDVTLNVDAGLVVSSATSARFTGNVDLYEAITNNGILTIDSLSSIDHLAVSEDSLYRDGNDSRNGFLYAERVQVVNMRENAQLTVTTKPTTYNGKAGTLDTNTGVFSVTEASESYDTFYVNKAGTTESLANAIQKSSSTVESIRMAGGTTLDASNVMEGAVLDNLILREHGDAAPATITGGTAAFRNLVMEGAVSSVSVDDGAKLKVVNVIEVAANRTLATSGGGTFEATTVRSTGGVVRFSGDTLVSGGGSGQGGTDNKLGLAITGNGGTIALNGGTTTVTGAVYTNAQSTAIEVGTAGQDATLVATRMELGDNGGGAGTLTVGDNGKVVVTGGVNGRGTSNLKNDSLVLGEWSQAYTTNVQGSLYARDAIAMLGKDAVQSVNVQGGTMAVKGVWSITDDGEKNHNLSVTDGGRLILGESGIVAEKGSWNIDVTDSEIGLYADTSIGRALNLHGKVVANTDKYEFKGTGAAQEVVQGASAGKMTVSGAVNADASATLSKAGSGSLEISGSTAGFHGSVEVQGGILDIMNAASVDMQDVTIGSNGTLGVYKGETKAQETNSEGTIVIHDTKTLTAGRDAALNANLVMEEGSTLDVRGTGGAGLLMGSEVTLSKGMTLSDYSGEWTSWEVGTKYVLFTGVDGLDIGNGVTTGTMDYTQWVDAKEYFDNIQESNRYFLCYGGAPDSNAVGVLTSVNNGSNVGMVYIMAMPEPTTSTLSLLALAALAARRRRR